MSSIASSRLPSLQSLTVGLASVLRSQVKILDRQPNIYTATFPSEIVRCRLGDGQELRLLCKYGTDNGNSLSALTVHKGGVPYEAAVYSHILRTSRATTPTFYGAYRDEKTQHTWLILKYLDNSARLQFTWEPSAAMSLAARWIGRFHSGTEDRLSRASMRFVTRYNTEYYLGWARCTSLMAGHLRQRYSWPTTLCGRLEDVVAVLLASPPTVIHGEYHPSNVLFRGGTVYPVDWESAAVAAGEIDLAALTEDCDSNIVRQCELEYQRVRWPNGPPADFQRRLSSARLYLQFRWLCDDFTSKGTGRERPKWSHEWTDFLDRLEPLRSLGECLGLIGQDSP
jgi:hypothetical protein